MSAYSLSPDQVRLLRLRAQRLWPRLAVGGRASALVADMTHALGGVQAQEALPAALAICVRSLGLGVAEVERARVVDRSVVRLWAMRDTLHLVAMSDLGWLLPLLGPTFIAGSRRRYAQLGLDEITCATGVRAIRELLATHGPLTRAELIERIASGYGLRLEGQMTPYLIARAALEGYVCLGPDRGAKPTYALLDDWLGGVGWRDHTLPRDEAIIELARRHLNAYAPATPEDFAAWSGLPMSKARAAWRSLSDQLIEVEADGRAMWLLATHTDWLDDVMAGKTWGQEKPIVRLLPAYDTSLLGYRNRDLLLAPEHTKRVNAGGGIIHPTLSVDGRIVGTWKQTRRDGSVEITVTPFEALADEALARLANEVAAVGTIWGGRTASWRVELPNPKGM